MKNEIVKIKSGTALQKLLAFAALIVIYTFFAIFGNNFVSTSTILNILSSSYYVGFLAIGVTFVIITGGIDLSIGTVLMCSALIGALAYRDWGWPLWLALLLIVFVGTVFGLINGLLVTKLKLPPFIATLGMMMVSLGFGSIITNTTSKNFPTINEADSWFSRVFLKTKADMFGSSIDIPTAAIWLFSFFFIMLLVLNKTKIGRYIFAIGSNEEAVRLSGVKSDNWKCIAYVISGMSAGLGAIFYAATYSRVIPNTGNGFELTAIAAVVIGGTSLSGGVGSLTGTLIGVFIMSILKNGLVSISLPAPYQTFFTGLVVIGAVMLDIYRNEKANKVKKH
ncbi:MAG TPA: ABC transporter permease [Oscillospiraceae bacterium]|mgnify:CR=1 FL=1|nr:ABC transporter permease [Oscillospiraceae bacterium]HPF55825.1 ABC transporter permease [Clostridiales bacterium]HPK35113.1 ABC transporter permease [Oscillospiraceae bacterium]HPR75264.1 ABC transporter permease [Oscillospiraceae bacterium]